jgi:hypothetical protein
MSFAAAVTLTLIVNAPPSLSSAAARVRAVDVQALERALASAGLEMPPAVHITLVAEDDFIARRTPSWIVGRAFGDREVIIFPARVTRYPYDSLESVTQHEVVHLALFARSGGHRLPRWFHEGVATSVESGWGVTDQARLLFAALSGPTIGDVTGLFESETPPDSALAYSLAAALVNDLRERHGRDVAGRISTRVAAGATFDDAFVRETGETPDAAAARAWITYRRLSTWVPAITHVSAVWFLILSLAYLAHISVRRRRARLRKQWEEEERWPFDA